MVKVSICLFLFFLGLINASACNFPSSRDAILASQEMELEREKNFAGQKDIVGEIERLGAKILDLTNNPPDISGINQSLRKIEDEIYSLVKERNHAVEDLKAGYFCSKCKRSKTEIEKGGETFETHLGRVKGEPVAAPPELISQKLREYNDRIAQKTEERATELRHKQDTLDRNERDLAALVAERKQAEDRYEETMRTNNRLSSEIWTANECSISMRAQERIREENEARARAEAARQAKQAAARRAREAAMRQAQKNQDAAGNKDGHPGVPLDFGTNPVMLIDFSAPPPVNSSTPDYSTVTRDVARQVENNGGQAGSTGRGITYLDQMVANSNMIDRLSGREGTPGNNSGLDTAAVVIAEAIDNSVFGQGRAAAADATGGFSTAIGTRVIDQAVEPDIVSAVDHPPCRPFVSLRELEATAWSLAATLVPTVNTPEEPAPIPPDVTMDDVEDAYRHLWDVAGQITHPVIYLPRLYHAAARYYDLAFDYARQPIR